MVRVNRQPYYSCFVGSVPQRDCSVPVSPNTAASHMPIVAATVSSLPFLTLIVILPVGEPYLRNCTSHRLGL